VPLSGRRYRTTVNPVASVQAVDSGEDRRSGVLPPTRTEGEAVKWRHHRAGDTWMKLRFAFLPVRCENGTTVWLDWVVISYHAVAGPDGGYTDVKAYPA
jgi:hypothetical protein